MEKKSNKQKLANNQAYNPINKAIQRKKEYSKREKKNTEKKPLMITRIWKPEKRKSFEFESTKGS